MSKYRKLPVIIVAITFQEFIAFAKRTTDAPHWSIPYEGVNITHENDECYLIPTLEGIMKFTPDDILITGVKGEVYPCKLDIFEQTYEIVLDEADGIETTKSLEEVDKEIKESNTAIELTFGQKAVGASFNPSFMPEVDKVKILFGETIDIMEEHHKKECTVLGASYMRNVNRTESLNAVIRASSAIVKYLTWKD